MAKNRRVLAIDCDENQLLKLKTEIELPSFEIYKLDVTSQQEVDHFFLSWPNSSQRIEHWINCAGIGSSVLFSEMKENHFRRVMEVNFLSAVEITARLLPLMEKQGFGKIIHFSSLSGLLPAPLMSAYSASKHALVGWLQSLQMELELKDSPVSTLLVCPGFVKTPIIQKNLSVPFPKSLEPYLAEPNQVAREVWDAIESGKTEVYPSMNGKVLKQMEAWLPRALLNAGLKGIARKLLQ